MKTFALVLSLVVSLTSFAEEAKCKVGMDTDGLNEAQTAVIVSMAKQLEALGCKVGAPEHLIATTTATIVGCAPGTTDTVQGCLPVSTLCTVNGMAGVIYNNQCVMALNNGAITPENSAVCTSGMVSTVQGCAPVTTACSVNGIVGVIYNGQCLMLTQHSTGGFYIGTYGSHY